MPVTTPRTAFEAVARRRFLVTAWPWRSFGYVLTTVPVAGLTAGVLAVPALPWLYVFAHWDRPDRPSAALTVVLILLGAALLAAAAPVVSVPVAGLEHARLVMVDARPLDRRPMVPARRLYTSEATWRAVAYTLLLATVVPVLLTALGLGLLLLVVLLLGPLAMNESNGPLVLGPFEAHTPGQALPFALLGLALLPVAVYLLTLVAGGLAAVARALLRPPADGRLRADLVEITRSRARLVDMFEAERRRIERDLHDGTQQRLVSLTLRLGLAKLDVPADSPAARTVAAAHDEAKRLMGELRELIHGVYPQVLTDLGLPTALRELADRSPVPVDVTADLPARLPEPVEVAIYFMVAEALTNVAKHSGATRAGVTVHRTDRQVIVEVHDNGHGGADPRHGGGLTGLADRVAAGAGRMFLSSPPGGPTTVRLELPCPSEPPRPSEAPRPVEPPSPPVPTRSG